MTKIKYRSTTICSTICFNIYVNVTLIEKEPLSPNIYFSDKHLYYAQFFIHFKSSKLS